jgi:hypothetical protein
MMQLMTRWTLAVSMALGAVALIDVAPATGDAAPSGVSSLTDPAGDTIAHAPAFQDIVSSQMTRAVNGDFELRIEFAGAVPVAPVLPPLAHTEIWWVWAFDLDPNTAPTGYPAAFTGSEPEFLVFVSWDGTAFAGTSVDRRPLLAGEEAVIAPVEFCISGKTIDAVLPYALIGDIPQSFRWGPNSLDWAGPVGSAGYLVVDTAPRIISDP